MTSAEVFAELASDSFDAARRRRQRRIRPEGTPDLFLTMDEPDGARSLVLELPSSDVASVRPDVDLRGMELELRTSKGGGPAQLALTLAAGGPEDIFCVLCDDISEHVSGATDAREAGDWFLGRVVRWQQLLQRARRGLSPEAQRGLYTELWFVRHRLSPVADIADALRAWTGPTRSPRDFEGAGASLEVKCSISNQPQVARINGERQLDDTGLPMLLLGHLSLDLQQAGGESLVEAVDAVRGLADGGAAAALLAERLLAAGYLDEHADRYAARYQVRREQVFRIEAGFPRLVEAGLPDGVGAVQYQLAIAACAHFEVRETEIESVMKEVARGA